MRWPHWFRRPHPQDVDTAEDNPRNTREWEREQERRDSERRLHALRQEVEALKEMLREQH